MAADIKKNLKIVATLDDSKLKSQISKLKQDLGKGISLSGADLKGLKQGMSEAADVFTNKIKKAMDEFKKLGTISEAAPRTRGFKREQDLRWKATTERLGKEEKEEIRIERARSRRREQEHKRELEQSKKRLDVLKEGFLEERRLDRSITARAARAMGASPEGARGIAGRLEGVTAGSFAKTAGTLGGGIMTAGTGILKLQQMMAERQFRQFQDISEGRYLESVARQAGRGEFLPKAGGAVGGALGGAAGGALLGSFLGPLGTIAGGVLGGIGGGVAGAMGLSNLAGETRVAQAQPIIAAEARARELVPLRLAAMAGGGVTGANLNQMGMTGAGLGFGAEETLQQFLQARQFLGNRGTLGALGGMQGIFRATGVGVGEQAAAAERLAGAGNLGMAGGVSASVEILKKGVAAGLDVSKSGQFLKSTSEFLEQAAGFGRTDVEGISAQIAASMQGFAGGGEVTGTNIRQAIRAEQVFERESMGEGGGFAAAGKMESIQRLAPGATTGQFLGLMRMKHTDKTEDVAQALGLPVEVVEKVRAESRSSVERGTRLFGTDEETTRITQALTAQARGISTGEQVGLRRSQREFVGPPQSAQQIEQAAAAIQATPEQQLAVSRAKFEQEQITVGIGEFRTSIGAIKKASDELAEVLKIAAERMQSSARAIHLGN